MSFFSEVARAMGLDSIKIANGFQIINYSGEAVYVEGFTQVLSISDEEIALKLKKGKIVVAGEDLIVSTLEKGSVIIMGKINEVRNGEKTDSKNGEKSEVKNEN